MENIGLSEDTPEKSQMIAAIGNLVGQYNFGGVSDIEFHRKKVSLWEKLFAIDNASGCDIKWKIGSKVNSSLDIKYYGYKDSDDLDSNPKPFRGMDVTQLLTKRQMDMVEREAKFPGITYKPKGASGGFTRNTFRSCKYWVPKTVGFYQLRNTFAKLDEPFNTYMFVSDANAPVPVYDIDTSDKDDAWWEDKDNALSVANSLFLYQDFKLFDVIGNIEIQGDFGKALYKCWTGNEFGDKSKFKTWRNLLRSNLGWHFGNIAYSKIASDAKLRQPSSGHDICAVFQSLNNPYTNTNIVLATRSNYANFKKARAKAAHAEPAYEEKTWWNKKSAKYQGAIKRYAPNK